MATSGESIKEASQRTTKKFFQQVRFVRHFSFAYQMSREEALEGFDVKVESEHLSKLAESKEELISKVSGLKRDLLEWRTKLDGQVKTFRGEITDLRRTLTSEIDLLRGDFIELKQALKQQLEVSSSLVSGQ